MLVSRRVISFAALSTLALLMLGAAPPALAAGIRIVDDNFPSPSACRGAAYSTIQAAVNSFSAGQSGTIRVCAGTYSESVSMTGLGSITILGVPGAVMKEPGTLPLILARHTARLTVMGLTLDGNSQANSDGVLELVDTDGIVKNNVLRNADVALHVVVDAGARHLAVSGNRFAGPGEGIKGDITGGALLAQVTNNTMTGVGDAIVLSATSVGGSARLTRNTFQGVNDGVDLIDIARVIISRNTIKGFTLGIQVVDPSRGQISQNVVTSNQLGIAIGTFGRNSSRNVITGNVFEETGPGYVGIVVDSERASLAANANQIVDNVVTDPGDQFTGTGEIGIQLLASSGGTLAGTIIRNNQVLHLDTPYSHTGDTGTVIAGNHCKPVSPCIP